MDTALATISTVPTLVEAAKCALAVAEVGSAVARYDVYSKRANLSNRVLAGNRCLVQASAAAAYLAQASVLPAATAPATQARLCRLAATIAVTLEDSGQPATALLEPALVALSIVPRAADRAETAGDAVADCLERAVAVSDGTHAKAWWQLGTHLAEVAAGQHRRAAPASSAVISLIAEFGFGAASATVHMC